MGLALARRAPASGGGGGGGRESERPSQAGHHGHPECESKLPALRVRQIHRNSLSNSPCPLVRARGRGRYILLARAINNKPFQCSDGCDSPQRRRTAARVEQKIFMSSPACADGYDTPAQQREDSTTFMSIMIIAHWPQSWPSSLMMTNDDSRAWQDRLTQCLHCLAPL